MALRVCDDGHGDLNGIGMLIPAIAVTDTHDSAAVEKHAIGVDRYNLCLACGSSRGSRFRVLESPSRYSVTPFND